MTVKTRKFNSQNTSDFINLETYTSDNNLIIAKSEGDKMMIGRVYEMSPLAGGGSEFSDVIHNLAKTAPDDAVIQVSLFCYPDFSAADTFLKNKTFGGEVIQELISKKADLLRNATTIGWQPDVPPINVRKVIISSATPINSLSVDNQNIAIAREDSFLNNIIGCGFYDAKTLTAEEVVGVYRHFTNVFKPRQTVELDAGLELKYQIFGTDDAFDFTDPLVGQFNENTFVTCVTPKAYPRKGFHGLMNLLSGAPFNQGSTKEGGGQRILTPFILNTTIRIGNQRKEWRRVDDAIRSREATQKFIIKLGNEDPVEKLKDLLLIKKQCALDGNKFVYVSTNVFMFGNTPEQALNAASNMKGTFDKLDFDGRTVKDNVLVRFAQTLPMNFSPKIADKVKGDALMGAAAAGNLLPVFGDNLGNVTKSFENTGSPYITRRGGVHYFDPFVSDTHYSGLMAAEPGAGKSFALQDFITSQLAMGRYVYLLDNGRSAKKFCIAANGEYNEFGGSDKYAPSLNPFSNLTYDEFTEQKEGITSLLMLMAYDGETPKEGAKIAMSEAITAAFDMRQSDADIPQVIESLRSVKDSSSETAFPDIVVRAAIDLIPRLNAFISNPNRGKYFLGKGTINPVKQFCVFEIGSLGDDEHLKKCILFFVLNSLLTRTKSISGKKVIIADEAHDLIDDPTAGHAFEGIYLKSRKDGVSIWIVIQSLLKLCESNAGSTILNQSAWRLILQQPSEEITKVLDQKLITSFNSDPYFARLIKSVKSNKGIYSEMLILGRNSYEAVRLYVDKWTATLYSSEGDARDLIFQWIEQGVHPIDAVNRLTNDKDASSSKYIRSFVEQLHQTYDMSGAEIIKAVSKLIKGHHD